jgi:hypothetical protein
VCAWPGAALESIGRGEGASWARAIAAGLGPQFADVPGVAGMMLAAAGAAGEPSTTACDLRHRCELDAIAAALGPAALGGSGDPHALRAAVLMLSACGAHLAAPDAAKGPDASCRPALDVLVGALVATAAPSGDTWFACDAS